MKRKYRLVQVIAGREALIAESFRTQKQAETFANSRKPNPQSDRIYNSLGGLAPYKIYRYEEEDWVDTIKWE